DRLQRIKSTNVLDGVSAEITPASYKRVLAGRYELNEKLDRDPFGILYKAHDLTLGRTVLVRRFPEQDKNITRDIVDQTRIISALSHSNILALYDSGKDENHYFLVMEYAEGPSLRQYLSHGSLDISEICEIASQICLALAYAHKKGVVHKNLSPENIYINPGTQVKIAHFGIESKWEKGSTLVGKQYNSPEQLMGQKIDGRSDLYSFGTVLYEMLYGVPPFSGQDVELQHLKSEVSFPETPRFQVPAFLLKIIRKCMQKNKQKRYISAEEILEELEVADIVPGMVLNQRYEIIKVLGVGGMGHVYQARDRDLDEVVALKVLRAEISADPMIQKRFLREIKITRMITHPHVVKVFDIGKYKGNRYISMEYIEGVSLDEWLKKNKVDTRTRLNLLAKILQGVQAAHSQGIIHRDLKPQNVLIDRSMNPHVLDFGIARSKEHVDATSGQIMGSPKYMSPEQIQGKDLDKRSDVYAVGVLMYLMFTGEEPFQGDDPRAIIMKHLTQPPPPMSKIAPQVPEWVEKIVRKALEKDRNVRYASLKEILDDLRKGYETQKI
ncbi:MAG TPA: serine/threonine-protein kinase, partial [Acidobacteriota bacterium]